MKEKREKESWRSGEVKRGEEKQFNVELWTERSRCAQRAAFLVWRSIRETHTRARTNKLTHCWRRIASDCWQVHTHITSVTKLHGEATSLRLYQFCSYLLACASLSCLLLQRVVMVYCNITYLVWWPGSEVGDDGLRITSFPWTSRSCAAAHTSHQERMQKIKPDKKKKHYDGQRFQSWCVNMINRHEVVFMFKCMAILDENGCHLSFGCSWPSFHSGVLLYIRHYGRGSITMPWSNRLTTQTKVKQSYLKMETETNCKIMTPNCCYTVIHSGTEAL